jgi:hypothetical protein
MFIGHFALGFAAKRAAPEVSLAALFAAAQTADLLWPAFVALGVEQVRIDPGNTAFTPLDFVSYPYSHSLVLLLFWSAVFGTAYGWMTGCKGRTSFLLGGLVVSHWVLDVVSHRPDMPLYPGGPKTGLGLWNFVGATMAIELMMYAVGVWIYLRATRNRDAVGTWALVTLAAFLALVYIGNTQAPPPPSVAAVWVTALAGGALITIWAWWADTHREERRAVLG